MNEIISCCSNCPLQHGNQLALSVCLQVYKLCAEREDLPQGRKDGSLETIRERRIVLLTKSKDALYLTLDRIRGDRFHVCFYFLMLASSIAY